MITDQETAYTDFGLISEVKSIFTYQQNKKNSAIKLQGLSKQILLPDGGFRPWCYNVQQRMYCVPVDQKKQKLILAQIN